MPQTDLEQECMELARYPELSALAQCLWAYEHRKDKAAMKVAKEFFMRDPKHMARAVSMWQSKFTEDAGTGLYEMLARISIASLPLVPRAELAAEYDDKTMTLAEVRERVDAYKRRKSKTTKKIDTAKLFFLLRKVRNTIFLEAELGAEIDDALAME